MRTASFVASRAYLDFRVVEKSRRAVLYVLLTAIAVDELGAITGVCKTTVTNACTGESTYK